MSPLPTILRTLGATGLFATALLAQTPTGRVTGVVRDERGAPLFGAEVQAAGTSVRAVTDSRGEFVLRGLVADSARLSIRRLGFKPLALAVRVSQSDSIAFQALDVRLEAAALQLAPIRVAARPEVFDARLSGFYDRQRKHAGSYITRDRLERLTSHRFTDLLREVPGVRLSNNGRSPGSARTIRIRGANCPPQIFLDGFPVLAGEFDLDGLEPGTLEGVEIYHGLASVPAEFLAARGGERCGVIAIWTRPYRPGEGRKQGAEIAVGELVSSREVYTAEMVDIQAELKVGTAAAFYPDSLLKGRISGRVLIEFVVDTTGAVELATAAIVSSSGELFSQSALDALVEAAFRPAIKNGNPVRQVVQLPFVFEPPLPTQSP